MPTSFAYDGDGRLRSLTTGERSIGYSYDEHGNLSTVTDPANRVTRFTDYDALGRPLRVERADGSVIGYAYDANGNLTRFVTPLPAENHFSYNRVSRPASFVTPLGSTTSYRYNPERELIGITLPSGREIGRTFEHGLLTRTITPEGKTAFAYDCGSRLTTVSRNGEAISYGYDASLPIAIVQSGGVNQALGLAYNQDLTLSAFTYAGASEGYAYDSDGLLTTAGPFTITRGAASGLPEQVTAAGFQLSRTFNGYGEVAASEVQVGGSALFGYNLTRDQSGRITTKVERLGGTESRFDYGYDPLGRLLSVTEDGALVEEYRYDGNGNRISETNSRRCIPGRTLTHSIEDHIITAGPIRYEFDLDDNLAARVEGGETSEYLYASTGELLEVTLPDGREVSYVNDPLGRRLAKRVNGVVEEKYLWSGLTTLLAVYDANDQLRQRFVYADDRLPYAMTSGGTTYYLHYDQVGTQCR